MTRGVEMAQSVLERAARAMYRADPGIRRRSESDFDSLGASEQQRYVVMATAALKIIIGEPVTEIEALDALSKS